MLPLSVEDSRHVRGIVVWVDRPKHHGESVTWLAGTQGCIQGAERETVSGHETSESRRERLLGGSVPVNVVAVETGRRMGVTTS